MTINNDNDISNFVNEQISKYKNIQIDANALNDIMEKFDNKKIALTKDENGKRIYITGTSEVIIYQDEKEIKDKLKIKFIEKYFEVESFEKMLNLFGGKIF